MNEGGLTRSEGGDINLDPLDGGAPDSSIADAAVDAPQCPAVCTSCKGTTCNIDCPGPKCAGAALVCPAGLACRVQCSMQAACNSKTVVCPNTTSCEVKCSSFEACVGPVVNCGSGTCRVECGSAEQSCVGMRINAGSASSVCMQCRGTGGNPGCVSPDIAPPPAPAPCTKSCNGGGCNNLGNGFNACTDVGSCPAP